MTLSKSFLSDLVDSVVIPEGIPCCFFTLYALYFEKKGLFSDLLFICEYFILFFSIAQTYLLGHVTGKSNLAGWSADFCPVKLQQKKYIFERISNKLPLFFFPQDASVGYSGYNLINQSWISPEYVSTVQSIPKNFWT